MTFCVSTGDVLPVKSALPPYTAVIEWLPTVRVEVVNFALPALSVRAPSTVAPFLKVTLPVGIPVVDECTVVVNVTAAPKTDGFFEDTSVVVVAAFVTACVIAGDVLAVKFVLPPYTAVIECDPTASVDVVNVALPATSEREPRTVAPSLNVTLPVGIPVVDE